jgi:hypothetical protein
VPRAVLFAIVDQEVEALISASDDDERTSYVEDVIEERWDEEWLYELDKA